MGREAFEFCQVIVAVPAGGDAETVGINQDELFQKPDFVEGQTIRWGYEGQIDRR